MQCTNIVKFMEKFPLFIQYDSMDCGPTCLRMIASFYGKTFSIEWLRSLCSITNRGVTMLGLNTAAKQMGFDTICAKITIDQLRKDTLLPCILYWNKEHFVVLHKISSKGGKFYYHVADPIGARLRYAEEEFLKCWADNTDYGIVLCLDPQDSFYLQESESFNNDLKWIIRYIKPYKTSFLQLFIGLVVSSLLLVLLPFFTQSIVDFGIVNKNIHFVWLILLAQLFLTIGNTAIDFIRNWTLLHVGTRVNVSLISDYIIKLTKLPISFFDSKMLGDVIVRIGDHTRIKGFITETGLSVLFSAFNIVVLGLVVILYNWIVFAVFMSCSMLYILWIVAFANKRAILDKKIFAQNASNQSSIIQLVMGMQEIKICGCQQQKRWEWERIQARIFDITSKSLALSQYQQSGALLITQVRNALITAIVAYLTIKGEMTIGMMLAIQLIIGQLSNPIEQLISFVKKYQDAKFSTERLNDIYAINDEIVCTQQLICTIPHDTINISHLYFKYDKSCSTYTLNDVSIEIPKGKTTAIVGLSGSGKTTLLKMLLGFYKPEKGSICIGNTNLFDYNLDEWRKNCGVVMQDGFIFSDTIAGNIAPGVDVPDEKLLDKAADIANILDFVHSLPLGYRTKVGTDGLGLSMGQKQRILIARAVYKNPSYLFMDEATNSLDTANETEIVEKMNSFLVDKTAVIIAHRLSTIRNADNIVVIEQGSIIEQGTHDALIKKHGTYYSLVKNQLNI